MRHLIRVMRRHELTKNTVTKTNTKTMTKTNTFREHLKRAIPEKTHSKNDPRDLGLLRHLIRVMRRHENTNTKTMTNTNTAKEHLQRVILVTCDI